MPTPNSLYPGARVALVCASSTVPENRLEPSIAAVKALGLEPVVYPTCCHANRYGNFAADDAQLSQSHHVAVGGVGEGGLLLGGLDLQGLGQQLAHLHAGDGRRCGQSQPRRR